MKIRAFATLLAAVLASVFALTAFSVPVVASTDGVVVVDDGTVGDTTRPTVNDFFPEERPLSDCFSALPKPNCGSEARGGWPQTTVFLSIVAGLAFIAWRVVAGARRARREAAAVTPGTPASTTVPDDDGGAPTP